MSELLQNNSEVSEVHWRMGALSYDEWERVGHTLMQIKDSINWWLGDWLNEGEQAFGETYAQAIEITGWDISRLQTAKWVASRVPVENRFAELTWSHHHFAAKYDVGEQYSLLKSAVEDDLSTRAFKERLKEYDSQLLLLGGGTFTDSPASSLTHDLGKMRVQPERASPKLQETCPCCGQVINL